MAGSSLSDVFLRNLDATMRSTLLGVNDLEQRLAECVGRARAAWPQIEVSDEVYVAFLAQKVVDCSLSDLEAGDLYLACACAHGAKGAIQAFERAYFKEIAPTIRRVFSTSDIGDEVSQELRIKLFVGEAGAQPKIAMYPGRVTISAWLRLTALRTALNLVRKNRHESSLDSQRGALVGLTAIDVPEMAHCTAELRHEFDLAVRQAASALSKRDRSVLQLHYQANLTMDEIGLIYRVHRLTVLRWIGAARRTLVSHTRQSLAKRLNMDSAELDSAMRLVRSQLSLTLSVLLDLE